MTKFPTPRDAAQAEERRKHETETAAKRAAKAAADAQATRNRLDLSILSGEISRGIKEGKVEFPIKPDQERLVSALVVGLRESGWSAKLDGGRLVVTPIPVTPPGGALTKLFAAALAELLKRR